MKFAVLIVVFLTGCTDTEKAQWSALGTEGDIVCYSGGKEIYSGRSTGKIATVRNSDGWNFKDKTTGKLIRVSGDCVIIN
jgi:hypothetical protein